MKEQEVKYVFICECEYPVTVPPNPSRSLPVIGETELGAPIFTIKCGACQAVYTIREGWAYSLSGKAIKIEAWGPLDEEIQGWAYSPSGKAIPIRSWGPLDEKND